MTLSLRLDPELESELARAAAQTGRSKSELVKASLREYLARLKSILDIFLLKPVVAQDGPMPVTGDGRASWNKKAP